MIITTFLKRLTLWRAQRGANVRTLEQYQASMSLPGTFKIIWSLRSWTATSIALVAIWSFYYVGSQASQREFLLQKQAENTDFYVLVPKMTTASIFMQGFADGEVANVNTLF